MGKWGERKRDGREKENGGGGRGKNTEGKAIEEPECEKDGRRNYVVMQHKT